MFGKIAHTVSDWAGSWQAFTVAIGTVIVWAGLGPPLNYSDTWQLTINTGTTIVTFLMVFLLQYTQNRDTLALHAKVDELIRANADARNELLGIEKLPAEKVAVLTKAMDDTACEGG
jgi:low affinity Fe/Cu permease